jgi:hypothetical protein
MKTKKSNTSQKIEQMRNQPEKPFQGKKCHAQGCQKSQELTSQICEKTHPNQHQLAKRLREDYT